MKLTYKLYHTVCHPSIAYTSDPTFLEFYFSKPEMAYTYLAEYDNGRHTFASLMDSTGANDVCIKLIMGHSMRNDTTKGVYTHKT